MTGTQKKKGYQDTKKPFPGCMGMMLNVFDFTAGMTGTKLLTDKAQRNGVDVGRNYVDSDKKPSEQIVTLASGKQITSHQPKAPFSNKSSGTPVKALRAQEMWKETEPMQKPSNVVARLMGLDSLPIEQSTSTERKNRQADPACNDLTGAPEHCLWQDNDCFENSLRFDTLSCRHDEVECKDVYEVLQKPLRMTQAEDRSLLNGGQKHDSYKTRMALVRQKFTEAKRLATDENLLQSKKFQDAIEILSSNRDLFLKFLEEPNSLFSKYFCGLQDAPPPSERKRITVLKPSIAARKEDEKMFPKKNGEDSTGNPVNTHKHNSSFCEFKQESGQPTRIVVLKPSPVKTCEMQTTRDYRNTSAEFLDGQADFGVRRTHETLRSRELAQEITRKMREHLSNNTRDESLLSSILSNGYIGDESSFNRSESEILQEESGSLYESDIAAPTLGYSFDNTNKIGNPFSVTSSRASLSPESAVVQEAKRRLSERLALVSSNADNLMDRQERKNSSTLGEMLADNDVNALKGLNVYSNRLFDEGHGLKVRSTCSSTSLMTDEFFSEEYPQNLQRSKSLPVSSLSYDASGLNLITPTSLISDSDVEASKLKNVKSCFRDKVFSFFFSRNKKEARECSASSSIMVPDGRQLSNSSEANHRRNGYLSRSCENALAAQVTLANIDTSPSNTSISSLVDDRLNQGFYADSVGPFQDFIELYQHPTLDLSSTNGVCRRSSQFSEMAIASNPQALGRSQPIGSIARSLTSSHFQEETLSSSLKPFIILSKADEEHEQFVFVRTLIESAGLSESSNAIFTRWHSLGSPINPILLDDCLQMEEEEAKCKLRQSIKKLLFDCANAAILDISNKITLAASVKSLPCYGITANGPTSASLVEEVWGIISNWISSEHCVPGEHYCCDNSVDRLATKEATGQQWDVLMWLEMYEFSNEISGRLLEELVEEVSLELI